MAVVHVVIARKKTQIFLDLTEDTPILEVKKMVGGIMKVSVDNMRLFILEGLQREEMLNEKQMKDYSFKPIGTRAHMPAMIGLMFRSPNGQWEPLDIAPVSNPDGSPRRWAIYH